MSTERGKKISTQASSPWKIVGGGRGGDKKPCLDSSLFIIFVKHFAVNIHYFFFNKLMYCTFQD